MEVPLNSLICNYLWGHEGSEEKREDPKQAKLFAEVVKFFFCTPNDRDKAIAHLELRVSVETVAGAIFKCCPGLLPRTGLLLA